MNNVTKYLRNASDSLIRINSSLKEMGEVVSNMNSPKQTKAQTQKLLWEKLESAMNEMVNVAKETKDLSMTVNGSARELEDERK